jgi:branched-chain amino acid transport system substrate-binding protein
LSGAAAAGALATLRFVQFSVDDLNAKGGITVGGVSYRFEGITFDDKATAEGGVEGANKLVLGDHVKSMTAISSVAGGAQPVTEANKVILWVFGGSGAQISPKNPFTLGGGYPNTVQRIPALYGQLAKTYPNAKRVAVLYDDTTMAPSVPLAQAAAKTNGQTVVSSELYPMSTIDFGPLVTRVLAQKPDAIDIGGTGAFGDTFVALVKALNEKGYKGALFGLSGLASALQQAGTLAEGYFFLGIADMNSPVLTAAQKDLIQRYTQKYSAAELQPVAMGTYSIFQVLAQAMVKAGTVDDTQKIVQTLEAGQWDTLWGKKGFSGTQTFGVPGYLDLNLEMSKWEGGKLVTFDAFNATTP